MVLGWGWKEKDCTEKSIYKRKVFSNDMMRWVEFMQKDGNKISCRDWYTLKMLEAQGVSGCRMVGCPAWYNLEKVDNLCFNDRKLFEKENPYIIISDAAFTRNVKLTLEVVRLMRHRFPKAEIKVLLHRGVTADNKFLMEDVNKEKYQYSVEDISGSVEGFKQYDTCDLHIGFRVHAHIYNLSMGNASILINEDARGYGVNDALGIANIKVSKYMENEVNSYLEYLKYTDFLQYRQSCARIQMFFFGNGKVFILLIVFGLKF